MIWRELLAIALLAPIGLMTAFSLMYLLFPPKDFKEGGES